MLPMTHVFYIILILVSTAASFFSGYKYATEYETKSVVENTTTAVEEVTPKPVIEPISTPEPAIESKSEPKEAEYAARAEKDWITFTDQQDRKLIARIMEVKSESLKIRRQADGYVFDLPFSMLSDADQAFAAYLKDQNAAPAVSSEEPNQSDIDKLFDQLFGEE